MWELITRSCCSKEFEKRKREEREAKLLEAQQVATTQLATQNSSAVTGQGDK